DPSMLELDRAQRQISAAGSGAPDLVNVVTERIGRDEHGAAMLHFVYLKSLAEMDPAGYGSGFGPVKLRAWVAVHWQLFRWPLVALLAYLLLVGYRKAAKRFLGWLLKPLLGQGRVRIERAPERDTSSREPRGNVPGRFARPADRVRPPAGRRGARLAKTS